MDDIGMGTQAVYYRESDGGEPVAEFLDSEFPMEPAGRTPTQKQIERAALRRAAIDFQIDRLNGLPVDAPPLPFPHSSQVRGELRELRCHFGRELYRVLYRRSDNLFVLLHMFRKASQKIPESEIRVAEGRWDDYKARMDAAKRKPPRAAGHDAP